MRMNTDDPEIDDDPGDEWWDEVGAEQIRGWIPPDDRLWRHPSESGTAAQAGSGTGPSITARSAGRSRSGAWIVGGAACVVLVLATTGLIFMTAGTPDEGTAGDQARVASLSGVPTTEAGVSRMPDASAIDGMVAAARPSLVALRISGSAGTTVGTGIVVESGGIIVTASQLLFRAHSVTVIETDGSRQAAGVIGIDDPSGLAVLRIADDLPAARFDATDPVVDSVAVAMSLRPAAHAGASPTAKVYAGMVASTGRSVGSVGSGQAAHLLSASVIEAPMAGDDVGCPLLDAAGQVSGLLEWTGQAGGGTAAVFLPAEVVLGVAQQVVTSGRVDHGWLGIGASDVPATSPVTAHTATTTSSSKPTDGARVDSVDQNGPGAAAGLEAGDAIVGIDGEPVHSKSELDARLYPDPPGTELNVSLVRDGATITRSVVLTAGGDASGAGTSP